jgi:hypothetical protein
MHLDRSRQLFCAGCWAGRLCNWSPETREREDGEEPRSVPIIPSFPLLLEMVGSSAEADM